MEETQQAQSNDSRHIEVKREERRGDKIFNFLFRYIHKLRFVIVIFWILAVIGFAYPALKFLGATSLFIEPPKGTLAYSANQLVNEKYPDVFKEGQNIVAIKTIDNSSVLTPYTETFSHQLNSWMQEQPIILSAEGYYLLPNSSNATIIDQTALEIIKKQFVGKSGDVTTIIVTIDDRDGTAIPKFVKSLRKEIKRLNNETDKYYVGVTGFEPGSVDLQEEIMVSLMKMDISCIPIAILVLLWVLKSLSLMIIPLCTIITSFVVAFGIMYPITFAIDIYGVAPALMMSCIAAMSIDYSLFLLTRFSEELSIEQSYYDVIKNTLQHAGRIIFTSGGLLTLCFVSLCFFPLDVIITLGMGAAISIFITIIVNLTLTPSLLGIFPNFFSKRGFIPCIKRCRVWAENKEKSYHSKDSLWYKFAVFLSNKKISFVSILIALVCIAPLCVFIKDFSWNEEDNQIIPAKSDSMISRSYILNEYPDGIIYPYELVISGNETQYNVFSTAYYNVTKELMEKFLEKPEDFDKTSYYCINYFGGHMLNAKIMKLVLNDPLYHWLFNSAVSPDNTTTRCSFIPLFNPKEYSDQKLKIVRDIISDITSKYPQFQIYVRGFEVDISDSIVICFKYFPIIIIVLFVLLVIVTAISFQSFIAPLRIVFSTITTVLWIYGFASFVFCNDYFDWTSQIMKESIGLYWCVPVITFPIIIGLSSDYDIFLFSRIMELRRKGLSTHLSVIIGVEKAGYLISYAGIIMAIAFSGLFLSAILMLNQFAFILMFSVLLDTFVIRSILLPAIVNLLGELNWFPKKYTIQFDNYKKYMDTISPEVSEETPIIHNTQNDSEEGNEKTALLN
ncbi:MmpL efflux pump, putative [Entamoeba histolytica HM-1:IMSS-B]|uniref:MmpL efflux pump, putative n=5 Tax=Entamoeba histolytica TaxID=5759 RepID=C4M1F4_ENTH1|nr:MmpL efflux pump, putative [Entamoeba histolytica HM-1:IMSS]EMD45424.1 MmpL efflux pump, putative [Entamoeba histolytica KU27]EMH72267.1 MmpL efflux pump, putative [Entamoeba histolytica HM-1:IMSS-B]ENY64945.1 MmpL efflux pump, putative [Entamoeba histolytica HM-1:IMSS-A]GAT95035.1 mmpl efflux pump putative [Entamoeba histolytica]EAL43283.1 MmpL efflux pump, putative [Entamoeba histolytica HM-1:IMSS]|eukprot:XP_648666.1 MmpL efflux pump, putative [Entamoeba histolytica HM-1:IMSS]